MVDDVERVPSVSWRSERQSMSDEFRFGFDTQWPRASVVSLVVKAVHRTRRGVQRRDRLMARIDKLYAAFASIG